MVCVHRQNRKGMKAFLEYVAEDIIEKFGTDLSHTAVVFPNKRASLFFSEYLAANAGRPLWSPVYLTISELFQKYSRLRIGDPLKLVSDLYHCFCRCTGSAETFDHFYGWGQVLLSDFDDVDKNMADASKVFSGLRDYHELDDVSYLKDEQVAAIRQFFSNFTADHNSELKRRFLQFWSRLYDIYLKFNEQLSGQNLAYEGSLYRQVVGDETIAFEYQRYIFVGFNLLNKVEQRLFERLKREGRAYFYWDFDRYYMPNETRTQSHEAGRYIAAYLQKFPNELSVERNEIFDNFSHKKTVTYISAATENIQARYVSKWLCENNRMADGKRTAIIMCNENLLPSIIYSFPPETGTVNITAGYPLSQTPVASLLYHLVNLQTAGYSVQSGKYRLHYVNAILRNPFVRYVSIQSQELYQKLNVETKVYFPEPSMLSVDEGMGLLFSSYHEPSELSRTTSLVCWLQKVIRFIAVNLHNQAGNEADAMTTESLFRSYTLLNRMSDLLTSGDLDVEIGTFLHLLRQLLQSTSIPFHGEPAEGVQVMGVLETRNLDFEHVLILSCSEGQMPRGIHDSSLIPYSIRKAHDLTTAENKVAIYSYYFYRLLQRASDVTIAYNHSINGMNTGEMSRFMLQMMVESNHQIVHKTLQAGQVPHLFHPKAIEKNDDVMRQLLTVFDKHCRIGHEGPLLTPTAINTYLRCPLQFFYKYICGLYEQEEEDESVIDNRMFGNIFHVASQKIYEQLLSVSNLVTEREIKRLLNERTGVERVVDEAFREELFKLSPAAKFRPEYSGLQLIHREVMVRYLCQLLAIDMRLAPFHILGLEADVKQDMVVSLADGSSFTTTIGGRIDRLDCILKEGIEHVRIIDYKTGNKDVSSIASVEKIFSTDEDNHQGYFLQTFLYAILVKHHASLNPSHLPVSPALLYIQHTTGENYDPTLSVAKKKIDDVSDIEQQFLEHLQGKVNEIFCRDVPFSPTSNRGFCQLCPYFKFCGN